MQQRRPWPAAVAQRLLIGGTPKSGQEIFTPDRRESPAFWEGAYCFGIIKGEQPLVCNGDDRGQRPKQGGAVGAAACRMRVPPKARSRRREPQPAASRASKVAGAFLVLFWHAKENIPGGERLHKSHTAYPPLECALHGKQHAKRRAAHRTARLLCSLG